MFNYLCNGSFISTHPIAAAAYHKGWARNGELLVELPNMEFSDFYYNGATEM
jgi:hypothetical protein